MSKPMNHCDQIKKLLVSRGQSAVAQDETLGSHLHDCANCQRLLQAWEQVPDLLDQLPDHEPDDLLIENIRKTAVAGQVRKSGKRRRFLAPSLASAAVLLAAIGLSRELLMREYPKTYIQPELPQATGQMVDGVDLDGPVGRFNDGFAQTGKQNAANQPLPVTIESVTEAIDYRSDDAPVFAAGDKAQTVNEVDQLSVSGSRISTPRSQSEQARSERVESEHGGQAVMKRKLRPPKSPPALPSEEFSEKSAVTHYDNKPDAGTVDRENNKGPDNFNKEIARRDSSEMEEDRKLLADELDLASAEQLKQEGRERQSQLAEAKKPAVLGGAGFYSGLGANIRSAESFDFLQYYRQTEDLQFQPASGYWANTYVPGDPEIRLLNARLAQWDRSWLPNQSALEQDVAPLRQPFDAPADNALALSLMADTNAVSVQDTENGLTRLRVQVGIQGIEHRRGQRPAMNVGLVVDLPADAPDEVRIATRALLDAMLQSKQAGDRFSLVLTGQNGNSTGLKVEASDFRFGSLQLAKQIILGQASEPPGQKRQNIDIHTAMQMAGDMVQQSDDPGRPLGSSSVLLISAREINDISRLIALTHERAREGITLSVLPLGKTSHSGQVEQLVLAGLGHRRYLETPGQARQLIEEELHASSRAVARAARLSVRLAPGVQLIGVVGSQRLNVEHAQRVREIENSMDRRLSANLGIQADRGEDEDGIQIVIPGIYSGDSLTVLLDVVTDRPGAIADVSLRYKDLVYLRNGSLSGHLELAAGEIKRGPAELLVLKNLLSRHFVEAVEQAAHALDSQQVSQAIAILRAMFETIEKARKNQPGWANDPDLIHDQQVLDHYISALSSPQAGPHQSFLTDSLRYAAWAKTHRSLEEWH